MSTSALILQHVDQLSQGELFTTRDLLTYGRRGAVDQAIYRMVKACVIIRLARGVFIKNLDGQRKVSVIEVARIKTAAFGKKLMTHAHDCAVKLGLIKLPSEEVMFNVSGHSSSFQYGEVKINLHGVSRRKFALGDSPHGMLMRALWYMEQLGQARPDYWKEMSKLNGNEILRSRKKARWVPSWLSDSIRL